MYHPAGGRVRRLERHLVTALLAPTAVVALVLVFRMGMGLSSIHPVLRSEGEEVAVVLMAVLFLGLMFIGMAAVVLVAVRLRTECRNRWASAPVGIDGRAGPAQNPTRECPAGERSGA